MVNQVYTVFSFIGIVLSVIPFYWHLQGKPRFTDRGLSLSLNIKTHVHSLEHGNLHVYDMDRYRVSHIFRQLHPMARKRARQGSNLLCYR
jgi:hypothetical protein